MNSDDKHSEKLEEVKVNLKDKEIVIIARLVYINMKDNICIKCGSDDLMVREKELEFNLPNPGRITVNQECKECQSCGEIYFNSKEMDELSLKIKDAQKG